MKSTSHTLFLVALAALTALASPGHSQTTEERARKLLDEHKAAMVVVTVIGKLSAKTSGEDTFPEKTEQRRTMGVTVKDNGLLVVSNSGIDSSVGLAGQKATNDGKKTYSIVSAQTEFQKVEIAYGDGVTLLGKVVKQDVGTDVALILPDPGDAQAKKKQFSKIDLAAFAPSAAPGDEVIALSRASAVYDYMPVLKIGRISGVYEGSRKFFVTTAGDSQGMPVFTTDGRVIGITLVKMVEVKDSPVVVPSGVLGTLSAGTIGVLANMVNG